MRARPSLRLAAALLGALLLGPRPAAAQLRVPSVPYQPLPAVWQASLGGFLRHADLSGVKHMPSLDGWEMSGAFEPLVHHLGTFRSPEAFAALTPAAQRADFIAALRKARADLAGRASRLGALAREGKLDPEGLSAASAQLARIERAWGGYLLPHQLDTARDAGSLVHRRKAEAAAGKIEASVRAADWSTLTPAVDVVPVVIGEKTAFLTAREAGLAVTKRRSLYYYNGIGTGYGQDPLETLRGYLAAGGKLSPNGWKLHAELTRDHLPSARAEELTALLRDAFHPEVVERFRAHEAALLARIEFIARHEPPALRAAAAAAVVERLGAAAARLERDVREYKEALRDLRLTRDRLARARARYEKARWFPAADAEMRRLWQDPAYRRWFELRRLDFRGSRWAILGKEPRTVRDARAAELAALERGLGLDRVAGVRDLADWEVERQEVRWFASDYNGLFKNKDDWFVWYGAGEPGISREHFGSISGQFAKGGLIFEFRPEAGDRMWWKQMFHGPPSKVRPRSWVDKLTHDTVSPSGNVFYEELNRVYAATPELLAAARAAFEAAWGLKRLILSGVTFHLFDEQPSLYARDLAAFAANFGKTTRELTLESLPPAPAATPPANADLDNPQAVEQLLAYLTSPEHFGLPAGSDLREAMGERQFADWIELNRSVIALARIGGPLSLRDVSQLFMTAVRSTTRHQPVGWRTDRKRHKIHPGGYAADGLWHLDLPQASAFFRDHRFRRHGRMVRRGTSWVGSGEFSYPKPDVEMARRVKEIVEAYNAARARGADPVAAAALLQRDIIALHPLTDGNGRASRALMDLELLKQGILPPHLPDTEADLHLPAARYAAFIRSLIERPRPG